MITKKGILCDKWVEKIQEIKELVFDGNGFSSAEMDCIWTVALQEVIKDYHKSEVKQRR